MKTIETKFICPRCGKVDFEDVGETEYVENNKSLCSKCFNEVIDTPEEKKFNK